MKRRLLVACERSQVVCNAFRAMGIEAYSADIEVCLGGHPEHHIIGDVMNIINGHCSFYLQTGRRMLVRSRWDMIIAHPPCTYLTKVGAPFLYNPDGSIDELRLARMTVARQMFLDIWQCNTQFLCIENPTPMNRCNLPRPTTYVEPFQYGEPWSKRTNLWLRNLPPLLPTILCPDYKQYVRCTRGSTKRSQTFLGIAKAMADQWSKFLQS